MNLAFLRSLDRLFGVFLLYALALPARLVVYWKPSKPDLRPRLVFLKLKGGGSLIIALPALLGIRKNYPQAEFILVCTTEARIYAELTGIFDRYILIDDTSLMWLAFSGWQALRSCFHAALCLDLEPNSLLAAVFTMVTCAIQRMGLVKPELPVRALAYTSAISFNPTAPIYIYYDQICEMLGAKPASDIECRTAVHALLPTPSLADTDEGTIGIAPFTSDFARERMMPTQTWIDLLKQAYGNASLRILIFGSARNVHAAREIGELIKAAMPTVSIVNLSGTCDLRHSASLLTLCDEIWAVDSGLLHITRLLGLTNRSFWGPTMPSQRLRPIADIREQVQYRAFLCSPCIQAAGQPPCGGRNLCMITMAETDPDLHPSWIENHE
jgi:ADP-heptose:LPS heptosyltransferase